MRAWLQLFRFPNLFTVPGDAMAGIALAAFLQKTSIPSLPTILISGATALCLYCYGLLLNDLHDYRDDCRFHPERPLPARKLSFFSVTAGMVLMLSAGLVFSATGTGTFFNGLILSGLILVYNVIVKRFLLLGSIVMGLCRGASFLLGIPLASWRAPELYPVLVIAAGLAIYVTAVTCIAKQEDAPAKHGWYIWLPFVMIICMGIILGSCILNTGLPACSYMSALITASIMVWFCGLAGTLYSGLRLLPDCVPAATTRREIGRFIRSLIFYQVAILILFPGTVFPAFMLLMGWPLSQLISRYIYSS